MANYPLPTLAPRVDETGISAPSFEDIYESLKATFRAIYGQDIYIAEDSQDGQLIGVLAKAINDTNLVAVAIFQSFSPSFAQGTNLSTLVKINGLTRQIATNSTCVGIVTGVIGSVITNGIVEDSDGNLWNLPPTVVIGNTGAETVTITAQELGDIQAPSGSITKIRSPQLGWQTFANSVAAIPGSPVETDLALRLRQSVSTSLPALTLKESISAAVGNVPGVSRSIVHENDTDSADADGIPAHSISVIVQGGDTFDIATAIGRRKAPGIQTYGTISEVIFDAYGLPTTVNYFPLALTPIYFAVTITALPGYIATTGQTLISTLVDYVNALEIGEDVYYSQTLASASLINQAIGQSYHITDFKLGLAPAPSGTGSITVAFNAAAQCSAENISLTVL